MERNSLNIDVLHQLRRCGHFLHQMMGGGKASQFRVLNILSRHENVTQCQLQELMGVRQSSMSELVQKLEEQGLITRERSESDRRQIIISLTDAGMRESCANEEQRATQAQEMLNPLSEEEQRQLYLLLEKLLSAWEANRKMEGKHPHQKHREES